MPLQFFTSSMQSFLFRNHLCNMDKEAFQFSFAWKNYSIQIQFEIYFYIYNWPFGKDYDIKIFLLFAFTTRNSQSTKNIKSRIMLQSVDTVLSSHMFHEKVLNTCGCILYIKSFWWKIQLFLNITFTEIWAVVVCISRHGSFININTSD